MKRSSLLNLAIVVCGTVAIALPAWAQIDPDNTLGNERSRVNPFSSQTDLIEGGATRGINLFHSFQEFNVDAERSVYFISPSVSIQNILARVTGNNPSQISGLLGTASQSGNRLVAANANLFLINPNGIVFGKDATLDVDRSFVATTANAIQLGSSTFSATNPQAVSEVLNVEPSAFLFNQLPVGNITVRSNAPTSSESSFLGLRVPNGQSLVLLGGNVNVEGGQLNAFGGRVEVGAIAGIGIIKLNPNGSLIVPDGVERADVLFNGSSKVDVSFQDRGEIGITASNIRVVGQSRLLAGIDEQTTAASQAGDLTLNATREVQLGESSRIANDVNRTFTGNGGNLKIMAGSLNVTEGSQISASTFGTGSAGNVTVQVRDRVSLSGDSTAIFSRVEEGGEGKGGNLLVSANTLDLSNGARLNASTLGKGNAGNVTVEVGGSASLNNGDIFSDVGERGEGKGGNLLISANTLDLSNGAQLSASTSGKGDAGNVTVEVRDRVSLSGSTPDGKFRSTIFSRVEEGGEGKSGNVTVSANTLDLSNGARLNASTLGKGNAGNVTVQVRDRVSLNNSNIFSNVGERGEGKGGNLLVSANTLDLSNGARLDASTLGKGNAGNVTVEVSGSASLNNGDIFSSVSEGGEGKGGNLLISANTLDLSNGAQLIASTRGKGDAGNVTVQVRDRVSLSGSTPDGKFRSAILSRVEQSGEGKGGNVTISANTLGLSNGARFSASTLGKGNAGNVTVEVGGSASLNNGDIFSSVEQGGEGKGGNLLISANTLDLSNGARLIASTRGRGDAGNVTVQARDRVSLSGSTPDGEFRSTISSRVEQSGEGNAGNVTISATTLDLSNGARLNASASGKGNAGNVTVEVSGSASLNNGDIFSSVSVGGEGKGGNLLISANTLDLSNGAQLIASTRGKGDAGNVTVQVRDRVSLSGSTPDGEFRSAILSRVEQSGEGKGGNLLVSANTLDLSNGAQLIASTRGKGDAGNVTVQVLDRISLNNSNIFSRVEQGGEGKGGNLLVSANTLDLSNGAQLSASTSGKGNAGNVTVQARDRVSLNNGDVFSSIEEGGEGRGGNVTISANTLDLSNSAQLIASTRGKGDAGDVSVQVRDRVSLSGNPTAIFSSVEQGGEGKGGNLLISANTLNLSEGAQLIVSTNDKGDAGNIFLGKDDQPISSISISGTGTLGRSSALFASTSSDRLGGNIRVIADRFRLSDGAVIDARTYSTGNSGIISLSANKVEILRGGQILAITQGSGAANSITVNAAEQLLISGTDPTYSDRLAQFGTAVAPISPESGIYTRSSASENAGNAGSIFLTAPRIQLSDRARIDVQSATVNGGNINIQASDRLLLRNNSQITATAGTAEAGGNGGNIDINGRFIIAIPKENSVISANAFRGNGGRVTISTQSGILGFQVQNPSTPLSNITASSRDGISGTVTVSTPDTSVLQNNLTQLPQTAIDPNTLLANSCIVRNRQNGAFYITGTGGLPTNPGDLSAYPTGTIQPVTAASAWKRGDAIVEPQGVYQLANGQLVMSRECP